MTTGMSRVQLFFWAASMTAAVALLPGLSLLAGLQVAGVVWNALRLSLPYLSEVGLVLACGLGALLVSALQWAQARGFRKGGAALPGGSDAAAETSRAGARWIGAGVTAGLAVGVAGALYQPGPLLAGPIAAGLAGVVQARLLPRADQRWVRAQSIGAGFVALSLLGPFPHWAAAGFLLAAGVLSAWGIRAATGPDAR